MTFIKLDINYTIHLLSPLRIGTGFGQAGYLDNTVTRNNAGEFIIPGSSIKGKVRAAAYRIASSLNLNLHPDSAEPGGCLAFRQPCLICRLFGSVHQEGLIHFSAAELHPDWHKVLHELDKDRLAQNKTPKAALSFSRHIRPGVSLERRQKVAMPDRLFFTETADVQAVFRGSVSGLVKTDTDAHLEAAVLAAALKSLTHLGGRRGSGLGRCGFSLDSVLVAGEVFDLRKNLENAVLGEVK